MDGFFERGFNLKSRPLTSRGSYEEPTNGTSTKISLKKDKETKQSFLELRGSSDEEEVVVEETLTDLEI